MEMSVALATDQLRVADWPRWMAAGSAVKLLILAACGLGGGGGGGGGVVLVGAGGGGGGGAGAFFLHPAAANNRIAQNAAVLRVLLFKVILDSLASSGWCNRLKSLVYPFRPRGLTIVPLGTLRGQLPHVRAVGKHGEDLSGTAALGGIDDVQTVRRPARILVVSGIVS